MPIKSSYADVPVAKVPYHKLVLDALWTHSVTRPNTKCLISAEDESKFWTHRDIWCGAHSVASYLATHGFGHRDIACTVLGNCAEYPVFFLGVSLCGGATSGASAMFTDYELEMQFTDCGCKVVLTDTAHLSQVLAAAKKTNTIRLILVKTKSIEEEKQLPWGTVPFRVALATPINTDRPRPPIDVDNDICVLPYSSGTTGPPKGVMLTHKNYGTMYFMYQQHGATRGASAILKNFSPLTATVLLYLPMYHMYGSTVLFNTIMAGAKGVIFEHFHTEHFLRAIQHYQVRSLNVVPPILNALLKSPLAKKFDLSSLEMLHTGGAPSSPDVMTELRKLLPNIKRISQGYGATEATTGSFMTDALATEKPGASGRLAALLEAKVVNVETGEEVPQGKEGEICVRGPTIMKGYLNRPEETAQCIDKDGWLHTGDIGYIDKDGDLFIVDRLKELIKVNGLQVAPAELEALLHGHPRIVDAAVIGVPDATAGELPRAYIVRADHGLTEEDVQEFIKDRVAPYKQLKGGVHFISEVPKSPSGKILRRQLRQEALKQIQRAKI